MRELGPSVAYASGVPAACVQTHGYYAAASPRPGAGWGKVSMGLEWVSRCRFVLL